jgi:hypothetical protein
MKPRDVLSKLEGWIVAKPRTAAIALIVTSIGWACASLAFFIALAD